MLKKNDNSVCIIINRKIKIFNFSKDYLHDPVTELLYFEVCSPVSNPSSA